VLARLVEHQDGKIGQERPGHGDALSLPSRQAITVPTDRGGQAVGQAGRPRS